MQLLLYMYLVCHHYHQESTMDSCYHKYSFHCFPTKHKIPSSFCKNWRGYTFIIRTREVDIRFVRRSYQLGFVVVGRRRTVMKPSLLVCSGDIGGESETISWKSALRDMSLTTFYTIRIKVKQRKRL